MAFGYADEEVHWATAAAELMSEREAAPYRLQVRAAQLREPLAERVRTAAVAENAVHADDQRVGQDDEPGDYDHDAFRGLKSQANRERRGIRRPESMPAVGGLALAAP